LNTWIFLWKGLGSQRVITLKQMDRKML